VTEQSVVAQSLEALRNDLTGRIDQMVSQREHDAETRRIDAETARLRSDLDAHLAESRDWREELVRNVKAGDDEIRKLIEKGERAREEARTEQHDRRHKDRQFLITALIGFMTVTVGAITLLLRLHGG